MSAISESTSPQTAPPPAPLRPPNTASALEEITARADTVWTRDHGQPIKIQAVQRDQLKGPHGRVAIVDGCRTPFLKSGTDFANMDVIDLASIAAAELVARTAVDPDEIDLSVFGVVVPALFAPNLGREVVFRTSLPFRIPGVTVNLACASSTRALTFAAGSILSGEATVVLAGGAESLTNVPIQFSRKAAQTFMAASRAKTLPQKVGAFGKLRPADLAPVAPAIAEYTTGQSMGESAEKMAKENDISRRAQDEIALLSHQRAAAATEDGRLTAQIAPAFPPP
ncbi:MAG TPA: beta-ketoacyl synthase N-terminal-like domain-containing protein, partial [Thermoanaerobaculia bacterium]